MGRPKVDVEDHLQTYLTQLGRVPQTQSLLIRLVSLASLLWGLFL